MAVVLVTGASQGIGRATAVELARRGHEVIATARNPGDLDSLDVARRLRLDVTSTRDVEAVRDEVGDIDVLLNNAGTLVRGSVEATPLAEYESLLKLNTIGALRVAQAFLPRMRLARHGRLLFASSILGRLALPGSSAYAATKWALEGIVETLALETSRFNLSVGLLEPGSVSTSGVGPHVPTYSLPEDPYSTTPRPAADAAEIADTVITPAQAAHEIADVVEADRIPLRVPIGAAARIGLQELRAAPADQPFVWTPGLHLSGAPREG